MPHGVIGSQTIGELQIDGSGSAIGLPLFEFIEIDISGTKLKDLILKNSPSLSNIFSSDKQKSDEYFFILKDCLENKTDVPITDGLNKQLLWPLSDSAIDKDNYISLIPLYPSSFTLSFDKLRKDKFYSEKNKNARAVRYKKNKKTEQLEEYVEFIDSAIITLGGSQPQNVSKLVVSRKGKDYLLSSLPPLIDKRKKYSITKQQKSIFNHPLHYHCKAGFDDLYKVVDSKNNIHVRNMRKTAIDMILYEIICFAVNIQNSREPGWSRDFDKLPECEKLWLDPKRAEFDEENDFMKERNMGNWRAEIVESFARWINNTLQKKFKDIKHQFGMAEYREWLREIEDEIKTSLRNGEEVFR